MRKIHVSFWPVFIPMFFIFSVVSLDPAPLVLDRQMEGLKRILLRIPVWTIEDGKGVIKFRLAGN